MAVFKIKTKNQMDINKKPRVYFTCHPDDFEKYFMKVCDDIFKTHDCAVYYTEDMTERIPEDEKTVDLGRNNLFVVPVTYKLLSTSNRAMDEDIPYALKEHIPVLPIMMETGIDVLYSHPDKFGELQYLNPFSTDITEISYEEKLKKYLECVLISDETAKRIRAAFDAYIFLSYRKKDRKFANELMRIIHSIPECRDIAIWFDEFLTPGESFKESIDRMLHDSKLFTLLVTPNLLEEPDGKPNFVMREEYPAAYKSGIDILAAEMEETDREALREKFEGISTCIKPDDAEFHELFLQIVSKIAIDSNNTPEHNFLIGLAYLDGIDVEVNREYALELITGAAENGLPEAMKKLRKMYDEGIGVAIDYRKADVWGKKLADYMSDRYGKKHPDTLAALNDLAISYIRSGKYTEAVKILEEVYVTRCKVLGDKSLDTLDSLNILACAYYKTGALDKAMDLLKKAYILYCEVMGTEHTETLTVLANMSNAYTELGDYKKSAEGLQKVYNIFVKLLGEEHSDTLTVLNSIAVLYCKMGIYEKAKETQIKSYRLFCKVFGKKHPNTLRTLNNLAFLYCDMKDYRKALNVQKNIYACFCDVLGEEHPDSIASLIHLSSVYSDMGNYETALDHQKKAYKLYCKTLGEKNIETLYLLKIINLTEQIMIVSSL